MKSITYLTSLLLLSLTLTGCATSQAQLLAQAKSFQG
jgi:hypothetical protein